MYVSKLSNILQDFVRTSPKVTLTNLLLTYQLKTNHSHQL